MEENVTRKGETKTIVIQQVTKSNGMGVAGFVLALVSLIFCWVPILSWILWFFGILLSFFGMFKRPRGLAIAGFLISVVDFILLVLFIGAFAAALSCI